MGLEMNDDFDWSKLDDADMIQESVSAIAVYENPKGNIVIRQQEELYSDGDSVVVVPKEKAAALVEKIRTLAGL